MRKTKKHKVFSIEEKNQIVLIYLDRHMGSSELMRTYDISSFSVLHRWIIQYNKYGTCVDFRGKATTKNNPNKGRPRKYPTIPPMETNKASPIANPEIAAATPVKLFKREIAIGISAPPIFIVNITPNVDAIKNKNNST